MRREMNEETINMLEWGRILPGMDIPTIEIIDPKMEEGQDVVGYLHPFRAYKFQVSGTADGHMDLGSTRVIGLGHLLTIQHQDGVAFRSNRNMEGIGKELILAMIALAVTNFCHTTYGYGYIPPEMERCIIDEFVDVCYDYINRVKTEGR